MMAFFSYLLVILKAWEGYFSAEMCMQSTYVRIYIEILLVTQKIYGYLRKNLRKWTFKYFAMDDPRCVTVNHPVTIFMINFINIFNP